MKTQWTIIWIKMVLYEFQSDYGTHSYYIARRLKKHWDQNSLRSLKKMNMDKVYIVDGGEGSGKSVWTMQQMAYLDPRAFQNKEEFLKRMTFNPDEFYRAVTTLKNTVICFDEAFRGLSSRSALSKINKKVVQLLQEMRQQNNIIFIVLPSIFLLDMYAAMLRSKGLFHIYIDKKSGRRIWKGYNEYDKNAIYQLGIKRGWRYLVSTRFKEYFYNRFPSKTPFEEFYLEKKGEALKSSFAEEKPKDMSKKATLRSYFTTLLAYSFLKRYKKLTQDDFAELLSRRSRGLVDFDGSMIRKMRFFFENQGIDTSFDDISNIDHGKKTNIDITKE